MKGYVVKIEEGESEVTQRVESKKTKEVDVEIITEGPNISEDFGWTEPVGYGCCCVCHENNPVGAVTDCEWCPSSSCDINKKNMMHCVPVK